MKYKFLKDGQLIEVDKENWCWEVYYNDGSFLKQFDDDGNFHQFKEIDQTRLSVFKMVSDELPSHTIIFNPKKMKLIHYYKRYTLNFGTPEEKKFTVYCFGYEIKNNNKTSKYILLITPTGEAVLTDNPDNIDYI